MNRSFPWVRLLASRLWVFDPWLLLILMAIAGVGLATLYSAVGGSDGRFADQVRNFGIAFGVMWVVAQSSPRLLQRRPFPVSPPLLRRPLPGTCPTSWPSGNPPHHAVRITEIRARWQFGHTGLVRSWQVLHVQFAQCAHRSDSAFARHSGVSNHAGLLPIQQYVLVGLRPGHLGHLRYQHAF